MEHYDLLIIGAGAAGIAAAEAGFQAGSSSILLVDRRPAFGGVLRQCLHHGFSNGLNGPAYIEKLTAGFPEGVKYLLNTTVVSVSEEKQAVLRSPLFGRKIIQFQQLILATGCLEIPIGALPVSGTRPKGIYTAGQMQEMMNLHGLIPEGPAVILGSGDLGLIMANHLAQAGIVVTLVEKKDSCGGMARNRRCLQKYPIELICGETVTEVCGCPHLEQVVLSGGREIPCKTLLIAVGLQPEQELIWGLGNQNWIHICGNCNRVHPMVEAVIQEGKEAGLAACENL